jgi:hypothetical protein
MDNDLEQFVRDLRDRQEIEGLSRRYAMGIDMRDWELYRSAFADAMRVDFTSWSGGSAREVSGDDWVAGVRAGLSGFQATQHMIVPYTVELTGPDTARSVAYMYAQHFLPNDKGDNWLMIGGHYTNTAVRTPAGWRFDTVTLTVTWTAGNRHIFELVSARWRASQG